MEEKPHAAESNPNRVIVDAESIKELWSKTYNTEGKPDWSHILPYYDDEIYFRDSIQEIHGMADFRAMTERLTERSKELSMKIVRTAQADNYIFIECCVFKQSWFIQSSVRVF